MEVHYIQRHILTQLISHPTRRYSQLRPERIEANQFVYHLKQLIGEGFIEKCQQGYELTTRGRSYADKFDPTSFDVAWDSQPRNVIFIALHNPGHDAWLLVRRLKQPAINMFGFIATDVRLGEYIIQTAAAHIANEYKIHCELAYHLSGSATIYRGAQLESYCIFQLLVGEITVVDIARMHDLEWHATKSLVAPDIIPTTSPIIKALHKAPSNTSVFLELISHIR